MIATIGFILYELGFLFPYMILAYTLIVHPAPALAKPLSAGIMTALSNPEFWKALVDIVVVAYIGGLIITFLGAFIIAFSAPFTSNRLKEKYVFLLADLTILPRIIIALFIALIGAAIGLYFLGTGWHINNYNSILLGTYILKTFGIWGIGTIMYLVPWYWAGNTYTEYLT